MIVAVDGHDVAGPGWYLYRTLTRVPVGATLKLSLKRGDAQLTVSITAARPQ